MNINDLTTLAFFLLILLCVVAIHVRDDVIRAQDKRIEELGALCNEALWQRDDARQALANLSERTGAYLREATLLVAHNEYLKSLKKADVLLDAGDIISGVEEYLAKGEEIV